MILVCDRIGTSVLERPMSAAVIFVGFIATTCILLTVMLLSYETFREFMTDFALAGLLLGLGSFVILTAIQILKDGGPPH
jgi:hypothetical protein